MELNVVILAAGKGSRMKSRLPKVLHRIAKKPMIHHVVKTAREIKADKIIVVFGHGGEQVQMQLPGDDIGWVEQKQQLGTGHAVLQALPEITGGTVLVLYGDVSLITRESLENLLAKTDQESLALLTALPANPKGYGRIIRDDNGAVQAIVEEKDATQEQKQIGEVNTGILAAPFHFLEQCLPALGNNNAQGEYYLTDVIAQAVKSSIKVNAVILDDPAEAEGVNDRSQLAAQERYYQMRLAKQYLVDGLTLADPSRFDVRGNFSFGSECFVDINAVFEGDVHLGDNVSIEPNTTIVNSALGNGVTIKANSHIEGAMIGDDCTVGPFARIRPGTELKKGAKIGNFVETKKTILGEGSKASHLTYLGDAEIGENVNVGAGTITCNYDGINKYKTVLEDGVFIGSNTSLVAPVKIGKNATTGAGSVITQDAEAGALAVARGKQKNISGWKRPEKKT